MSPYKDIVCRVCGSTTTAHSSTQKYCGACTPEVRWRQKDRHRKSIPANHNKYLSIRWRIRQWAGSEEEVDRVFELWLNRSGFCEICGESEGTSGRALCIDHCHTRNVFRGFLCVRCNRTLGSIRDDPDWLRAAERYLG